MNVTSSRRRVVCFSLVMGMLAGLAAALPAAPDGHWEGEIALPNATLGVVVNLAQADGLWSGTIDIPMQGAKGLPLIGVRAPGDSLIFTIDKIPGAPTFRGVVSGDAVAGTFSQGGQSFPFTLGRGALPTLQRPQEPKPPLPYRSEEVGYDNGPVHLAGTLTIPAGEGPFPAALLITGSGAQNRDEELFGHRPFLVLADALTRAGIAVLRVDDRGVGSSTGSVSRSTTADFADDALAGVSFLQQRSDIDRRRVGLIGHSEGGIVGPLVAAKAPDQIAFLVLMAGTGVPLDQVVIHQTELMMRTGGASAADIDQQLAQTRLMTDLVRAGADSATIRARLLDLTNQQLATLPDSARAAAGDPAAAVDAAVHATTTPWFRFAATHDPVPVLRQVRCPVLAMNGTLDLQVDPAQNLPPIEQALRDGGNDDITIVRLPGLNHLFQTATTGAPQEYGQIEETMSPRALDTIKEWVLMKVGR